MAGVQVWLVAWWVSAGASPGRASFSGLCLAWWRCFPGGEWVSGCWAGFPDCGRGVHCLGSGRGCCPDISVVSRRVRSGWCRGWWAGVRGGRRLFKVDVGAGFGRSGGRTGRGGAGVGGLVFAASGACSRSTLAGGAAAGWAAGWAAGRPGGPGSAAGAAGPPAIPSRSGQTPASTAPTAPAGCPFTDLDDSGTDLDNSGRAAHTHSSNPRAGRTTLNSCRAQRTGLHRHRRPGKAGWSTDRSVGQGRPATASPTSVRDETPSLRRMFETWTAAVFGEI